MEMGASKIQTLTFLWIISIVSSSVALKVVQSMLGNEVLGDRWILNHLVVDQDTDIVYVGAVNRIFQLDSNLTIINEVVTGPKNDSIKCPPPAVLSECDYDKHMSDNHNKILVIHNSGMKNKLITCGSLYQGACETRNLFNITRRNEYYAGDEVSVYAVAANQPQASTVGFIGPGPPDGGQQVLYVAATYTGNVIDDVVKSYRDKVPAISSRSLRRNRFAFAYKAQPPQDDSSSIHIKQEVRSRYLIHYVTGFSSGVYSYFLTVQPDSTVDGASKQKVSKIIHVCQKDPLYYSYADMPIQCIKGLDVFNIVKAARMIKPGKALREKLNLNHDDEILVGVFTRLTENGTMDSAVCMYTMKQIRAKLLENIKKCYQGIDSVSGGGYLQKGQCQNSPVLFPDDEYLCNRNLPSFANIVGTVPVISEAGAVYQNLVMTAIAVTTTTEHTVAFVGTRQGHLKKIVLEDLSRMREYDDIIVDGNNRINQDMYFDSSKKHIFVMSQRKIFKLKVENCGHHNSCSDCLANMDPFCGWCALEKKCIIRAHCPQPSIDRWLSGPANQCIVISDVSPRTASVTEHVELYLTVSSLPQESNYTCVFVELSWSSPAKKWNFGVYCITPKVSNLGITLGSTGNMMVSLALNSSETGKLFVAQSFTFYDCSSFKSCTDCTNNNWMCDWCIYEDRCTYNTTTCSNDRISSRNRYSGIGRRGAIHCPKIDVEKTGPVFLPENVGRTVVIKGVNFPFLNPGQEGYQCVMKVFDRTYTTMGHLIDQSNIRCDIESNNYPVTGGFFNASFYVYWGNSILLETTKHFSVTIYKCEGLADGDCSLCRNLAFTNRQLQCQWCDGQCKYSSFCYQSPDQQEDCPAPLILHVKPVTGPVEGGTRVNITGRNLGSVFDDIRKAVTIAGIPCRPIEELYSPSKWIICILGRSSRGPLAGPVMVKLRQDVQYPHMFHYQDPNVLGVYPRLGPKSGGSLVTICGSDMDTGNSVTASIGYSNCPVMRKMNISDSNIFCKRIERMKPDTAIVCRAPGVDGPQSNLAVYLYFDRQRRQAKETFTYVADPTIKNIHPLETFASGGRVLTVTGTNFHAIQQPMMFAIYLNDTYMYELGTTQKTMCTTRNSTTMVCPSPSIPDFLNQPGQIRYQRSPYMFSAELAFQMDAVEAVQNLSGHFPGVNVQLIYYPDPEVYKFIEEKGIKTFKGEVLIFEGNRLNIAASKEDLMVLIGRRKCNITNLSANQLYCTPPHDQPKGVDENGMEKDDILPAVIVKVGNLNFIVGRIRYDVPERAKFPDEVIAGIAAAGGFLFLVIILILIIYRRQSTKAERIYRKMQIQLDNLESNVRNECKQAFAELQTDMTDLTSDLENSGIPFWDYPSYSFKVLFPGLPDHEILHPPLQMNGSLKFTEQGLHYFYQLLNNKYFLLNFIHTLENQRTFTIRDKASVASLLIMIYQDNMEYATDILKSLLNELVEKSVASKHPKLMLRRTESVVEKLLTNWLSLCFYRYLKNSAGSSLFMLYKAIKLQVEKGPVDQITGDARYSLAEDRLLREKIEPKTLTLNIETDNEMVQCKTLDCDTITQVKEKICDTLLRNIPFSQRPCVHDLDLDWRKGAVGLETLQDEDSTTEKVDGWIKLNTLQHYRVYDGANMVLLKRHHTLKSPNGSFDATMMSVTSSSPIVRTESDSGTKVWHLVKHHEDAQISEIFLNRLLVTKGTLQKYIEDFFRIILTVTPTMPPVIKYLFDFLDEAAHKNGLTDPDIVHTWKCNSLPLRFWVNIIKNPDFVFDIHKPSIVDASLSVVAQTFMDSCSTSELKLGKDSPSSKLLFAKDINNYRKMVEKYFKDIHDLPAVSDQEMNSYLAEVSRMYSGRFYKSSALTELYSYVSKYANELMYSLDTDSTARRMQLLERLGQVITAIEGPSNKVAYV